MQDDTAFNILNSLASGCDPETGEVFPRDHIVQQPDVIRALGRAVTVFRQYIDRNIGEDGTPARVGQPWSAEEDERLLKAFDNGAAIEELAVAHERSRGAIQSRLVRLGRIERETSTNDHTQ